MRVFPEIWAINSARRHKPQTCEPALQMAPKGTQVVSRSTMEKSTSTTRRSTDRPSAQSIR
ncbi:hypothetical protein CLU88_2123 [Acidovorax sp. 56]|nr:hypothetical protein CLU88_2123 [Acidovorax sp. 56]